MPPGRSTAAKHQAATARRVALFSPQSATVHGESSQSAPQSSNTDQPAPLPPPVLPRPPPAPPLTIPPSTGSPAPASSPASVESAGSAASPAPAVSPEVEAASPVPDASQPRSIRSKGLYVRGGKNKRGVVTGCKTDTIVRLTGKKIVVKYSTFHNGPAERWCCSLLTRDIGSCVRDRVPMIQPTFLELEDTDQDIVSTFLSTNYEIASDDGEMWDWIGKKAENSYRQWKCKCKAHWKKYGDDVPLEFLNRTEQWEWLVTHFKDENFQALCIRNQCNRTSNPDQMHHHSGALALSYRASEHAEKGSQAPYVAAFLDAYEPDPKAKDAVVKVKRKLGEVLETQSDGSGECISVDVQVAVIEVGVGRKKGTVIRGVGGAIRRDPKRRGVARQSFTDSQADERIQKVLEEAQLAKEEAQRAKEEALRAKEEWLRAREEIMDRLQALEAGAAAKQVHPCGSSTQIPTAQV